MPTPFTVHEVHAMQLAIDASARAAALGDEPSGASLVSPGGAV